MWDGFVQANERRKQRQGKKRINHWRDGNIGFCICIYIINTSRNVNNIVYFRMGRINFLRTWEKIEIYTPIYTFPLNISWYDDVSVDVSDRSDGSLTHSDTIRLRSVSVISNARVFIQSVVIMLCNNRFISWQLHLVTADGPCGGDPCFMVHLPTT